MKNEDTVYLQAIQTLRKQVEESFRFWPVPKKEISVEEYETIVQELKLHEIELELQTKELLKSQRELVKSRDEFASLYDSAPIGCISTGRDGLIKRVNIAATKFLDCERLELLGKPLTRFVADNSVVSFQLHQRAVARMGETQSCELTLKTNAGRNFSAQLDTIGDRDETGEVNQYHMMFHDISRRRKAEEAISQSKKLESLSVMAGGLTHDYSNLLTAIISNATVALKKLPEDSSARRNIENILIAAKDSTGITQQMLTFTGRNSSGFVQLDLNKIVSKDCQLLKSSLGSHIELELDLYEKLPAVMADRAQVSQAFINLILNASQALGTNIGKIKVTTETVEVIDGDKFSQQSTGHSVVPGRYVALTITDNGKGIEPEVITKIFDPFFSTRNHGNGLGLANVLGVMRGHDGAIFVESEVNVYTNFSLLFPIR
ncbi:MAG: nitrogen regulation protein NR(II) [Anaerolineae bacterium]